LAVPFAAVLLAVEAAVANQGTIQVRGQVVDAGGNGVVGVTVFAVDPGTHRIPGTVTSADRGAFSVTLPRSRYQFGIFSPDWSVIRVEKPRKGEIRLVVQSERHAVATSTGELEVNRSAADARSASRTHDSLQMVTGRLVSATGTGLGGVRLTLEGPAGRAVATTYAAATGDFATAARPGRYQLQIFAPGLRLLALDRQASGNRWLVTLGVVTEAATVRVEVEAEDPDNPSARARAALAFRGVKVTGLPALSPTLAELHAENGGTAAHPVARQPLGALCIRTSDCQQGKGVAVCCADNGDLTDEYLALTPGGVGGTCKAAGDCPGARARRRRVVEGSTPR
jgi:hypothetical protein